MARYDSQEDARFSMVLHDQWGRQYHAVLEKETMMPTGPIEPQFQAPIHVPQKYLRAHGKAGPNRLTVELDSLQADLEAKHDEIARRIQKQTMKHFPGWTKKSPPPEVLDLVTGGSTRPMPVELVYAMRQGNRWVLGFSPNRPAWSQDEPFKSYFDPPVKAIRARAEEMEFPNADEDAEMFDVAPLIDGDIDPRTHAGGLPGVGVGVGGDHSSWGNVEPSRALREVNSYMRQG